MSKLYQKYQQLKKENPEKCYLFKSGIFYIFLEDDAKKLGPMLSLKITNLNDSVVKCGFPAETIIDVAEEENADLIVISASGKSGIHRFVIGSVAEKVLKLSDIDVLLVHNK